MMSTDIFDKELHEQNLERQWKSAIADMAQDKRFPAFGLLRRRMAKVVADKQAHTLAEAYYAAAAEFYRAVLLGVLLGVFVSLAVGVSVYAANS